jgi:alpha-beta hydrolase superfamily lysophospholipase
MPTYASSEGAVHYERWASDEPPVRIVIMVHGYAEYAARYGHVADALTAQGAILYGEDHMGHGRSDGERALIVDFEHVVDDVRALVDIAVGEHARLPVVMIGHSMCGLLRARFAQRHPDQLAGIVFLGAVIGDWHWARDVLEQPELPPGASDFSGMSRDQAAVEAYATDPLIYRGPYKRPLPAAEIMALDRFQADIGALTMPVLFCHGTEDPFVDYQTSLAAVESMPSQDKTIRIYDGARHELVSETNRDDMIAEIVDFVERVTSG